jgi:pseudaminic acid cytidylyltransferase
VTRIAIIPARGGSKRIPKKNIREFFGIPAISRTLNLLVDSEIFDHVIVSTDSEEIARVALTTTSVRIIARPSELADDFTPTVPVISHAIMEFTKNAGRSNQLDALEVCCVYPINPFLNIKDLSSGLSILQTTPDISYVNSIVSFPYPIQRAVKLDPSGKIEMFNPSLALTRSQDLEEAFHDAGQWYWGKAQTWLTGDKLLFNSIGVQIPRWRAQDIDTIEDWELAEKLFRLQQ